MALSEYEVETKDGRTETLLLSEKDAERLGAKKVDAAKPETKAKTPANKARTPQNKAAKPAAKTPAAGEGDGASGAE